MSPIDPANKLAPWKVFLRRMGKGLIMFGIMLTFSLGIGVLGYHFICKLGWTDSLLNASMILTGMGPVDPMVSQAAKVFASAYAIFSGVVFLTTVAVLLAPILHRAMHIFHLEDKDREDSGF